MRFACGRILRGLGPDQRRVSKNPQPQYSHCRLIDAVAEGIKMLDTRPPNNRRVMLILSESRDRGSKGKLSEAIEQAQRAGVVVYPATYSVQGSHFCRVRPTAHRCRGATTT